MAFSFEHDMLWRSVANPETVDKDYEAPAYEEKVLPAGWRLEEGKAPFRVDTIWEKDVEIILRDGIKTRADIFRPAEGGPVPALIAWSPYGKAAYRFGGESRPILTE
jgi:predicted acyl esterase